MHRGESSGSYPREDGRKAEEIRLISVKTGVLCRPSGSATVSFGNTTAIAAVYGPQPVDKKQGYSEKGILICEVKTSKGIDRDASRVIKSVLETVIHLDSYPNSNIEIQGTTLQSGGSDLSVMLTAASIAIAKAGIDMFDLVTACHLVGIEGEMLLDPTETEFELAEFELFVACHPSTNKVCHFNMSGTVEDGVVIAAVECCLRGCTTIKNAIRSAL